MQMMATRAPHSPGVMMVQVWFTREQPSHQKLQVWVYEEYVDAFVDGMNELNLGYCVHTGNHACKPLQEILTVQEKIASVRETLLVLS